MSEQLHFPTRMAKTKDSRWQARCACGQDAPVADEATEAEEALAETHGVQEPATGCALCGRFDPVENYPGNPVYRYPWQRYRAVVSPSGGWEYVCSDQGACRQRCLGAEQSALIGEPWMELDPAPWDFTVSLDATLDDVDFDLDKAIAMYRLAHSASPRDWQSITTSAGDQRALAARAVALSGLFMVADSWRHYAILCARRAGVTWEHLANLLDTDAEDLRDDVSQWYRLRDWPWTLENTPQEIKKALEADPQA